MLNARENPGDAARENELAAKESQRAMSHPIRVLIVDDHAILRAGVRECLPTRRICRSWVRPARPRKPYNF